ncbi:MAG: tetratricopeptide repeat protein [Rhizobiales bacterium]|nr:tetratricopeptide repeat protein [Rhizobacter sp.]
MLGISATTLTKLIAAGFVSPVRGRRNEHRFSFQDLMLLRTAHALQQARIPPRKILRSLAKLKSDLPVELPLTGLRITAVGADVVVRDRSGQWDADSGQSVMDFEVAEVEGTVTFLQTASRPPASSIEWFRRGEALEATDKPAAELAYRRAIQEDPLHAPAYLNLGAVLCEDGRCDEAVSLYEAAIRTVGHEPLIHFNHAIALEDQNRPREALTAYERALALDAGLTDAHYNASLLLERLGDEKAAFRHLSAYRRLQRTDES